jgi:hypothetical protein
MVSSMYQQITSPKCQQITSQQMASSMCHQITSPKCQQITSPRCQQMASSMCQQIPSPRCQQIPSPSLGHVWPPVHHPQNSMVSVIRADDMSVEQTAAWVRTLGRFNQWEEADEYAQNFARNNIWGYLLQKLTNDALKHELGIAKYGHRLEIMLAIKCLFPMTELSEHLVKNDFGSKEPHRSPMIESVAEAGSMEGEGEGSPVQIDRSPSLGSMMTYSPCNTALEPDEHKKEVKKWVGTKAASAEVMKWVGRSARSKKAVKSSSPKVLPFDLRVKSARARPSNPVVYKTLRKVKLRSGKSGHGKDIGYLPKGSVVVINQIKGRSGRVVVQQEAGGFKKAGWVTLYTQDKQQLLKKFNQKAKNEGVALPCIETAAIE